MTSQDVIGLEIFCPKNFLKVKECSIVKNLVKLDPLLSFWITRGLNIDVPNIKHWENHS